MQVDLKLERFKDFLDIRKSSSGKDMIFDPLRKKELVLLPEETVRQLLIQYLLKDRDISDKKIQIEKKLSINKMVKRYDLIVYDKLYNPVLLVECKSYKLKIQQANFDQLARYNIALKVPYLMLTNGLRSYLCKMDYQANDYMFLNEFPDLNQ